MDELLACEICTERFSAGAHEPLILNCGHTYCRSCLVSVRAAGNFLCPSCRKSQGKLDVDKLVTNYKVLSAAENLLPVKLETCAEHHDQLSYWCQTCNLPLCVLCIFNGHSQEHQVVKGAVLLEENRNSMELKYQQWKEDMKVKGESELQDILKRLKSWLLTEATFSRSVKSIEESLAELKVDFGYESLNHVQGKINSLMLDIEVCNAEPEPLPSTSTSSSGGEERGDESSAGQTTEKKSKNVSSYSISNFDGWKAEFHWQNGRLFLSAFRASLTDTNILFSAPSQVFLDLSIHGRYLGRVIIQLWYHLRRAKQFALLCLGALGVSYLNATFKYVLKKGHPRECLVGGWYICPQTGMKTCSDILTDLEWGGDATGKVIEGTVMGMYEERNGSASTKSGFGICTREEKWGVFQCPFGMVVSGLDVVKQAVLHTSAKEVIISNCGAVVTDRMSLLSKK